MVTDYVNIHNLLCYCFRSQSREQDKDDEPEQPRRPPPRLKSPSRGRTQLPVPRVSPSADTCHGALGAPTRGAGIRHSVADIGDNLTPKSQLPSPRVSHSQVVLFTCIHTIKDCCQALC